jgi:hypothetical protein
LIYQSRGDLAGAPLWSSLQSRFRKLSNSLTLISIAASLSSTPSKRPSIASKRGPRCGRVCLASVSCHRPFLTALRFEAFGVDFELGSGFGGLPRPRTSMLSMSDSGMYHTGPRGVSIWRAFGSRPLRHHRVTVGMAAPNCSATSRTVSSVFFSMYTA